MSIVTQRTKFAEITDKWGRFRSIAIISPDTPTVSAGEDGFLWLDTSTPTAPVLKVYDEDADTWVVVNNAIDASTMYHNDLGSIQGGAADDYYHMTSAQHTAATRDATNAQNGLMPTAKLDNWDAAFTHIGESGASHLFIDQDVTIGAGPAFTNAALTTPALGTPSAGVLTSCTGLPIGTGVSGLAANVATFLATPSSANLLAAVTDETGTGLLVFATTPTLTTPILGTPTSGTLTNCDGLPISTGVSGLAANVATFLATPTSANLIAAVTDETGSGALVFANTPALVTPAIGAATGASLDLTGNLTAAGGGVIAGAAAQVGTVEIYDGSDHKITLTSPGLAGDWVLTLPIDNGDANEVLVTDGAGVTSWTSAGVGDVTAATELTDHTIIRGDAAAKAVQDTGITIDDTDNVSAMGTLGCGAITINAVEIVGADGEVNKAAVEDSGNWDAAYAAIHNAVTLDANADTLLSLSTQELGLDTQVANTILAGPNAGGDAVPTFRVLVAADIPALGANPSQDIGLAAVNGAATTYLRSDGAPALSQAIIPTWTGDHDWDDGGGRTLLIDVSERTITLSAGTSISEFSTDGTLAGDSDDAVPTEKAVFTAIVDNISRNWMGV